MIIPGHATTMDERSKKIAKNTLMLYIRTFFTMIISFWTSRLMLEALGIDNYGIKNVVGSIVGFSGLLTGAMSAAGSRFITYAIGKGDLAEMKDVFRSSFHVQIIISIIILLALEIIGTWFLNNEANIPISRMFAANFVLQTAIMSLIIGLLSVPYNSLIIAHERMSLYAYLSIVDVALQFVTVLCVLHTQYDRLIMLSALQLCFSTCLTIFYAIYSRRNFEEARLSFAFNWKRIKELCSFSGWTYIGNATWVFNTQGLNMLVNSFFGVAFNAARGISGTVNGCIQNFVNSFTMAFTPQITKSYAANDKSYCFMLVNRGTRIACMLQILFIVPIFLEADTLLKIWLVEVPPLSAVFLRFALVESFVLSLSGSLMKLIRANGKIKRVVLETSIFSCLVFPLTWLAFRFGMPVWVSYPVMIIIYSAILVLYIYESYKLTAYDWKSYIKLVIRPCVVVVVFSFLPMLLVYNYFEECILRFMVMVPASVLWTSAVIYLWGLDKNEKMMLVSKIKSYKDKLSKKRK